MGRKLTDGGLLRYRKWVPQQLGDVIKQGSGDSRPMRVRHGNTAANHNSTYFLVWSTGPLLIFLVDQIGSGVSLLSLFLIFSPGPAAARAHNWHIYQCLRCNQPTTSANNKKDLKIKWEKQLLLAAWEYSWAPWHPSNFSKCHQHPFIDFDL